MQYITDETGTPTYVVLTVSEWEAQLKSSPVVKTNPLYTTTPLLEDVRGSITKERGRLMTEHIRKQRQEGR